MNTEALDTLKEILNSEMYEVWGLNANEPEQYEKCLNRLKEQVQQYVDSECKKELENIRQKAYQRVSFELKAHPPGQIVDTNRVKWEVFEDRFHELNTGGIK